MAESGFVTPPVQTPKPVLADITPVGDHDRKPKIQVCLEIRNQEVPAQRKSKRRTQRMLEITVLWVKHLPLTFGKSPSSVVKLRLLPRSDIHTTELHTDKTDAQFIEVFSFPLNRSENVTEMTLDIEVCENKATRNAKLLGSVSIPLGDLKEGQPSCKWYHLWRTLPSTKSQKENQPSTRQGRKGSKDDGSTRKKVVVDVDKVQNKMSKMKLTPTPSQSTSSSMSTTDSF